MSYIVPIGPYHPALEEPCRIDLTCEGETAIPGAPLGGMKSRISAVAPTAFAVAAAGASSAKFRLERWSIKMPPGFRARK